MEEVFNLDNNTQLEFLHPKTVIVIDKNRFLVCKQLLKQNARGKNEIILFWFC
jgi:hypothetical protein